MKIIEKLTSRGALIVILAVVCFLFILFAYAVSHNAEISLSNSSGLFKIIPKGSERIKELEGLLDKSVPLAVHEKLQKQYQQLENENLTLKGSYARALAALGADIQHEEDAIQRIEFLTARFRETGRDISVSLSVIQDEVAHSITINTNSVHMDEMKRGLYLDIQKFFTCIGIYNGEINGDQCVTCQTVKQFQERHQLKADGIIGPITLDAMETAFERARLH